MQRIQVQKSSGDLESFSRQKIMDSLIRTGVKPTTAEQIATNIRENLRAKIPTQDVYRLVKRELQKKSKLHAARYGLKHALSKLGPEGFLFEKYIAALWERKGYQTKVDVILPGRCVAHEVDVVAKAPSGEEMGIECKFHHHVGKRCDVKTALYVHARALDLGRPRAFLLATNAKFSRDAIAYAQCSGLSLLGWDFPEKQGLREQVTEKNLYPITCLAGVRSSSIDVLLKNGFILCEHLRTKKKDLERLRLPPEEIQKIFGLAENLLQN